MVFRKWYKRAVLGVTAALVLSTCSVPVFADSVYTNPDASIAATSTDATYMNGLDLAARITATVEQDQRSAYANKGIAVVDNYLEIYAAPDSEADVVGKMYTGSGCEIREVADGWSLIVSGDCEGYVESKYLLTGTEAEAYAQENNLSEVIALSQTEDAYLYEEPSADSPIVATVLWDQELKVLSTTEDGLWMQVSIGDQEGYLPADSVVIDVKYEEAVSDGQPAEAASEDEEEESTVTAAAASESTSSESSEASEASESTSSASSSSSGVSISDTDSREWATYTVSIRSGYGTGYDKVGVLGVGESILVTGICDNGWSRVSYDGQTAYIKSEYLTSVQPVTEEENTSSESTESSNSESTSETVYATTGVNVRAEASADSTRIGALAAGQSITRTGSSGDWSIVSYNGSTGYVKSEYLSTTKPESSSSESSTTTLYATTVVNVRDASSTDGNLLGTLSTGDSVTRTGEENGWSIISYNGGTGYVKSDYLSSTKPESSTSESSSSETVYATENVNVRTEASTDGTRLGTLSTGDSVTRTGETNGWSIISYNGQTGYVKSDYLSTTKPETQTTESTQESSSAESTSSSPSYTVTDADETVYATEAVNVRSDASSDADRIGGLSAGESITRTGTTSNGWSRVSYNGSTGYVNSDYLTTTAPTVSTSSEASSSSSSSSLGEEIASFAKQYVGYPYVYGGNSLTNGVDCSGFTQQVYLHFGYSIPRRASIQATVGESVSISNLQAGDLVFYGDSTGVGHVAIYIGGGQVVHASSPSVGIIISNLYYRTPLSAKRII